MRFLYEKQTRRFCCFLAGILTLQTGFLGFCGILHARNVQNIMARRELAAVSCLLEQGVPPTLVASAWNHTQGTEEGARLLRMIGHTDRIQIPFLLSADPSFLPFFLLLLSAGILCTIVILTGTTIFFRRREQIYADAEQTITQYADNRFEQHLPAAQTGTIYQLFGKIEQLAQSLQAKNEMEHRTKTFLKEMISHISHQLKTPLAALSMYQEIILEEPENTDTVTHFAQKSMESLERTQRLIQSLLTMARLDTGNIMFEKRPCRISWLVEQATGDLLERARREQKEIRTEGNPEDTLLCDPEWTTEALGNLIKNALDHTKTGGIIRISWEETPAVSRLTVTDNGCGIGEEEIHHIFRQFYRGRSSGDRQGTGLGLSLAKSIVEGQGGSLSVESSLREGSTFHIILLTDP